ncbi:PREDICTED: WPP domain-associated protein isoform X1 [Ipomoea nil]|uniref:WPP domain-associated protein isoform X1 n=1 Tax=Ipomoea nil TaxID=35883 RepID=UPI0009013CCF|nr:PREDICTED: WPP domain-associated protein isoform X1 [Ipomoea nil]
MDDCFDGIDCRSKCDPILMKVLRSAMDIALEKVQPKDGPIKFLNGSSKFYELAAILVDGGFSIVQEEGEIPVRRRKKILSDLEEMRQWLYGRVEVMQMFIIEKNKELMDRFENEIKLRKIMEMKEKELALLHEKVKLERRQGDVDCPLSNEAMQEGEITELKYSLDLEDADLEKSKATKSSEDEFYCQGHNFFGFKPMTDALMPEGNKIIQQMTSDSDILKRTLDFTFGKVHSTKVPILEKQWRHTIETKVLSVLIKGFVDDIQQKFNANLRERKSNIQFGFTDDKWTELIMQMTMLREELDAFSSRDSFKLGTLDKNDGLGPLTNICTSVSDPLPEFTCYEPGEDKKTTGSHYIAEMIKSHEAIIRKQHKDLSWSTGEKPLGKGSSLLKRKRESDSLERRMQECTSRLDRLISWSHGLVDENDVQVLEPFQKKPNSLLGGEEHMGSHYVEELKDEIRRLKGEAEDSCLQNSMMEQVYLLLCQGLVKDFNAKVSSYGSQIRNHANRLSSMDFTDKNEDRAAGNQPDRSGDETKILEYILREDILKVFMTEMINLLKQEKDAYEIENLIREDIHNLVITEAVKDVIFLSKEAEGQGRLSTSEDIPSSARNWGIEGEETLIQVLDSVFKCLELEEDLVLSASSEIEQHSVNHYLEIFRTEERDEREAIQWLLDANESILSSVNIKLAKALKQLITSKELLMDLERGLGLYPDDNGEDNNNATVVIEGDENMQPSCQLDGDNRSEKPNQSDNAFSSLRRFQQVLSDFEDMIIGSLEKKCLRIEELKQQLHELVHPVASLRKRKQLYKKAFITRCQNLHLAETEVDLLGDQVNALLEILEKIYLVLSKNSSALSCQFEVSDIVRLIKKELADAVACTPKN